MIYTTLDHIREHNPCADGWRMLLKHLGKTGPDDAPLAYIVILDALGLDDALWCLRAEPQHSRIWRMYAIRCARRVQHLLTDERSLRGLDAAERHARGLATDKELDAVWVAAWVDAWDAARVVAGIAARVAARVAAARDEQTADFRALLAAHHAMPGESCALVDWWQGESND